MGRVVLLLGAGGFIGSHVRRALEADPSAAVPYYLDRRPPAGGEPDEHWITLDLVESSRETLARIFERLKPETIVNCVGITSGSAETLWPVNVGVVDKLLRVLPSPGAPRLIHIGSAAEYGQQEPGAPIPEGAECRPVGEYGQSKLVASDLICECVRAGRLEATVLRVFNAVGAGAGSDTLPGLAAAMLREAVAHDAPVVEFGALDAYRDFVDARDIADAAVRAAVTRRVLPPVLNVGSGVSVMSRTVVLLLAAMAGYLGEIRESKRSPFRSGEVSWQQADIGLIGHTLDWHPRHRLESSLSDLWHAAVTAA